MASLNSSTHVLARLVTETESKLEGEGEKEPKGMASLNSSTHVHAGSEGSFSRRTTRRTCTPGAVSCGRRREGSTRWPRPPSACRRHCGGSSHDAMSCNRRPEGRLRRLRPPSACTTGRRCRAAVVVSSGCGHRRLAGGSSYERDAVVSCAKIGRSAASARIRTIRLQSRTQV